MFILILLFLTSCGSVSLLSGKDISFNAGQGGSNFTETIYLSTGNTFTISESYPNSCAVGGTWKDSNPGSYSGTLTLSVSSDSCNSSYVGQNFNYNYTISNRTVVIN